MLDTGKTGSKVDATVRRGAECGGSTRPINRYKAECFSSVEVRDMEQLGIVAGANNLALPPIVKPGHVSHAWVKNVLRKAWSYLSVRDKREFDRLLIGGRLVWSDEFCNIVVNTGLDDYLDKFWKGSTYTAAHYVGLTDGTPTVAAGDTMASHAGWTEVTAYSESNRPTLTLGSVSSQSVDNSASKADFTASGSTTVGGAFITTDNTKGGTSGTLITVGAFSGDKALTASDTLSVTATLTMADS